MYLIDTTYCSKIIDKNEELLTYLSNALNSSIHVVTSVISQGELSYMVEKSNRKEENKRKVLNFLDNIEVLSVDSKAAEIYGELKFNVVNKFGPQKRRVDVSMEEIGVSDNDLWIAAISVHLGLIVVSNDDDFPRIKQADNRLNFVVWPIQ
jgi:tRNA(fMet)-specific endonuclease VapC